MSVYVSDTSGSVTARTSSVEVSLTTLDKFDTFAVSVCTKEGGGEPSEFAALASFLLGKMGVPSSPLASAAVSEELTARFEVARSFGDCVSSVTFPSVSLSEGSLGSLVRFRRRTRLRCRVGIVVGALCSKE